jgi:hypothetical protein
MLEAKVFFRMGSAAFRIIANKVSIRGKKEREVMGQSVQ